MSEEVGTVTSKKENAVTTIEFSHPKGNSLPGSLLLDLQEAIREANNEKNCRVIVLRSSGNRAFCGGASFSELAAAGTVDEAEDFFLGFARILKVILESRAIVLVRVQGKTVGGGVGIVSASDFAVASPKASVRLSELELGIGPFVIGPIVERRVGTNRFRSMAIGTEWKSPGWCESAGLFDEVVESEELLDERVSKLAAKFAGYSPDAVRAFKQLSSIEIQYLLELAVERALTTAELSRSEFTQKKIRTFLTG